jgi:hypothetical protein
MTSPGEKTKANPRAAGLAAITRLDGDHQTAHLGEYPASAIFPLTPRIGLARTGEAALANFDRDDPERI